MLLEMIHQNTRSINDTKDTIRLISTPTQLLALAQELT